jgi:hypothetical protein
MAVVASRIRKLQDHAHTHIIFPSHWLSRVKLSQ